MCVCVCVFILLISHIYACVLCCVLSLLCWLLQLVYAFRLLVYSNDIQRTVQCIGLLKDAGSSLCRVSLTEELLHFAAVGNVDVIKVW